MNETANSSHAHDFGPPRLGKQTGPAGYETYFDPCSCGLTWEVYLKQKVRGFNAQNPGLKLALGAEPAEESGPDESPPANARPFADLSTAGILWAINRALLHPRGYALALHRDQDGNAIGWSLKGDGREPWIFEASVDEDRHFADFERLLREQAAAEGCDGHG